MATANDRKSYVVRDDNGKPLGAFEAPSGASDATVAAYAAKLRRELLARRAARERRRLEPQSRQIKCTICGNVVPIETIGEHIASDVKPDAHEHEARKEA